MNRDFLKNLGLSDDVINSVMAEHGKDVQGEQEKAAKTSADLEKANSELSANLAKITDLEKNAGDNASIIALFRSEIERGIERLVYGFDVLADVYQLSPSGDWSVTFDWSYALIESSQETFSQMASAVTLGAVEPAELRQYLMSDETLDEARARVSEIAARKAESSRILLDRALSEEREQ